MERVEAQALIGLDTNVLLRLALADDPEQHQAAERMMSSLSLDQSGFISTVVLCEFAWTLQARYGRAKPQIAGAIRRLVNQPTIHVEQSEVIMRAVQLYEQNSAGFSDCFIAAIGKQAGCSHTVTFDKRASRLPGMQLLT